MSTSSAARGRKKTEPLWPLPGPDGRIDEPALGKGFKTLREAARDKLASCTLPRSDDELWRFTSPQLFALREAGKSSGCAVNLQSFRGRDTAAGLSGLRVLHGEEAWEREADLFRHLLNSEQEDIAAQGFVHLQTALTSSLHLLVVEKNVRLETPLLLSQLPLKQESAQCVPWIVVLLQPGAQIVLIEDLVFEYAGVYFPRLEFVARDNSVLDFVSLQRLGGQSSYLGRQRFHLQRDVTARVMHAFLGGRACRLDLECRLAGQGSAIDLRSLYIADGERHVDFHPTQEHLAAHCQSQLLCKGIVRDKARAVYYGYIRVAEGAQKTDAYQTNRNLLFSSQARADSIPNLEIKANDVRCSHGSSVGQVGADELFYLMSRGLRREAAEQLLVEGFFEEVLSGFSGREVYDVLNKAIMGRLRNGSGSSGN